MNKQKTPAWRAVAGLLVLAGILSSTLVAAPGFASTTPQSAGVAQQAEPADSPTSGELVIQGPYTSQPVYPTVFNGDLRDLPQLAPDAPEPVPLRYVPGQEPKGSAPQIAGWVDSVAQSEFGSGQMPAPIENFAGLDFNNFGAGWPPDTVGDVGPDHYIQAVNTSVGIYDKDTGARLVGLTFDALFTGPPGSSCDNNNAGDVVVLYDASVDRWVVTDFAWFNFNTGPFYQCIAVSQTGDPVAGGWYFYELRADTGGFTGYLNDYPKLGVWSDGWYMSANMFQINPPGPGFGVRVWALDKASMIGGGALNEVHFDTCFGGVCDSLLPSNYRGDLPPAGSPNYFLGAVAPDSLGLFEFDVDWTTPGNSTLTGPVSIPVAPFAIAPSIPQPGTGQLLDSLSFRLMMQLQYRNINGVESLWANHSVASGGVVGVRWYELQDPGGTPTLIQQGTYQPDSSYRWMGALGVDQDGNMAVGYSLSSTSIFPSIKYAGRLAGEIPGILPQNEATLINGTGSQTSISRWGDYSAMTVDPVDDCTFWYTTEYYATSGSNWQTRIGSFKFPSCGEPKGYLDGTVYNSESNQPVPGVTVVANSAGTVLTAETDANGYYIMTLMADTYDLVAGPLLPGYPTQGAANDVVVAVGSTTTQDIYLDPVPYLAGAASQLDDDVTFGNGNGFPEPGERGLLLFKGLENIGAATSTSVDAELLSLTSGITLEVAASGYPDIAAGVVATNTLPYEFSIDPLLPCGADLDFQIVMTDAVSTYSSDFSLNASVVLPRADAISNNVEGGAAGWSTGGTQNTWAITTLQAHSPTHSWTDSPAGVYANNTNSFLRTPAFSLSGKRNVKVSGWYQYDLESGYDYVYLEYSLNGGSTWNTAAPLAYFNGIQDTWEFLEVDASMLDNQANVALRYRLVSDAGVVADGIYIDDIAVSYEPYECVYVPPVLPDPPGAPLLISPEDGATLQNPVTFEWQDSATGGAPSGYIFNLDSTPVMTFTSPVTSTVMTLTAGSYDWSVIAFNDGGASPESITRTLEVEAAVIPTASLQIAHLAPFAVDPGTAVTVTLDSTAVLTDFMFADSTVYLNIPAGVTHTVEIFAAGMVTPAISAEINLMEGMDYSAIAVGGANGWPLDLIALQDDNSAPPAGFASLRLGHLAPFSSTITGTLADVRLQDGTPVLTDVVFGAVAPYIDLAAGIYDLKITAPGGGVTLIDPLPVTLNDGDILSVYPVGDGVNQPLGVFALPGGEIGLLLPLQEPQPGSKVFLPVISQSYSAP